MTHETPEQIIAQWRAQNADDTANHNYDGPAHPDTDGTEPVCLVCGDGPGGLLHAFDPNLPAGFHDEAIYEVATQDFSVTYHDIVDAQGWTVSTEVMLALEFIRDRHLEDEYLTHLRAQAADENAHTTFA